jgi:N-acetyl-1-D-myo-inositol-2-amino-2-deoxy-alpha-D-glucopyranoside deacetylase
VPADDELPVTPDEEITTTLDVAAYVPAKLAALRAHATQLAVVEGDVPYFALTNELAQPIPARDSFVLAHGPADGAADDLFGGL